MTTIFVHIIGMNFILWISSFANAGESLSQGLDIKFVSTVCEATMYLIMRFKQNGRPFGLY